MSEVDQDYIPTRAGKYRSSRYPGFVGGGSDPQTGNLVPGVIGVNPTPQRANLEDTQTDSSKVQNGLENAAYDIPKTPSITKSLTEMAIGGGATYAGKTIGAEVGKTMAAGGALSEGFSAGANALGDKVSSVFSGGSEVAGAAAQPAAEAIPSLATGAERAATLSGSNVGQAGSGAAGGQAASSGFNAGSAAGSAAGSGIATAAVGMLTGQKPAKALKSGVGSAAGTYIGLALTGGNPIGGYIGSTIGSAIGGRVICTELYHRRELSAELLTADLKYTERMNPNIIRGYHYWAVPVVRLMRKQTRLGALAVAIARPLARWRAEEVAYCAGMRDEGNMKGALVRLIGEPICYLIGLFVSNTDWEKLYDMENEHV